MKPPFFNVKSLKSDIFSGIIITLVSIPISMGYAQIAGLPPVYGLYGSLLPILVYGFFSSSPQFVVGVDAMPAAMVGSSLAGFGIASGSPEAVKIIPAITLLVAMWLFLFRLAKAGRIVKYISTPVMGGFISGVGVTIILMQIPKLFGGNAGTGEIIQLIPFIIGQFQHFNLVSLMLGVGTVAVILISKKLIPKFPMTVLMLVIGIVLTAGFNIDRFGVKLLPAVKGGLPRLGIPDIRAIKDHIPDYLLLSLTVSIVIMAQTLLTAFSYASKYDYKLDSNKELVAYGLMNIAGAVSGSCPINGSVSRTGMADQFGCRTQFMSVSSFISMLVIVLFCTKYFIYLPVPVLTGIVMSALIGIIDFKQAIRLWKCEKAEFFIFMAAFTGVLFLGTIYGVMVGMMLSFASVVKKALVPPRAFLGKIKGQHGYYDLNRNSNSIAIKDTVIYRFGGNLFFANIDTFVKDIEEGIKDSTRQVIVDAGGVGNIDITAADKILGLTKKLEDRGIKFFITEHPGQVNDLLRKYGAQRLIDNGNVRRTMSLALRECGIEKPYPLEDGTFNESDNWIESDEKLAEFEWVFGSEAQDKMTQMAEEMVSSITDSLSQEEIKELNLEHIEERMKWGKIGLFDEEELLKNLEIKLEQLYNHGNITRENISILGSKIENRREEVEHKLYALNPKAIDHLHRRMESVEAHLTKQNPSEMKDLNTKKIANKDN